MALVAGPNTIEGAHGLLHVQVWPGDGAPLLAVHGVDGMHEAWFPVVAGLAGERTVVAVDLRGRGASAVDGPFGVAAHADDLTCVIKAMIEAFPSNDELGAALLAHSFGCHVAARVAAVHPAAVRSLLLVDGGPPRVIPDGMAPEQIVAGALSNIIPNLGAKPYPVSAEAVETDFASMVIDPVGSMALFDVAAPVHLVRAELGVAPGLPPVIPDAAVADLVRAGVEVTHEVVAKATHFSVLDSPELLAAVRQH